MLQNFKMLLSLNRGVLLLEDETVSPLQLCLFVSLSVFFGIPLLAVRRSALPASPLPPMVSSHGLVPMVSFPWSNTMVSSHGLVPMVLFPWSHFHGLIPWFHLMVSFTWSRSNGHIPWSHRMVSSDGLIQKKSTLTASGVLTPCGGGGLQEGGPMWWWSSDGPDG